MLCIEIIDPNFPTLNFAEATVGEALALSKEKSIQTFPVTDEDELKGILSVSDLNNLPSETKIHSLENKFTTIAIAAREYFLSAFKLMSITNNNIVPVIDSDNHYCGVITSSSLLRALNIFLDIENNNSGLIVLEMDKIDYSFSEISRIIEANDTNIIQLNTYFDVKSEAFIVTIKINRTDISEIVSTLQRHDYRIAYYAGEELYENEIKRNYDALMNYLSI